jgi:hypothetical protein
MQNLLFADRDRRKGRLPRAPGSRRVGFSRIPAEAVAEALGRESSDEEIDEAVEWHRNTPTKQLRAELRKNVWAFDLMGGRGVELADLIDSQRIALALLNWF